MTNISDLYTDFKPDSGAEASVVEVQRGGWLASRSIQEQLGIIFIGQIIFTVLIGFVAWFGVSRVDSALTDLSPEFGAQVGGIIRTTEIIVFGSVAIAVGLGVIALKRVVKDISQRVTSLNNVMIDMANGSLELQVQGLSRPDEFGEMARSIEQFRINAIELRRMQDEEVERAQALAEDQTRAMEEQNVLRDRHRDALSEVATNFDKTVGEIVGGVAAAASELQATATSMAANADQSLRQSARVGEALTEATGGVTAAAAASEEFAISIGEISRQASTSAELARKASGAAVDADKTISELTESAAEVGKVVQLISHIAQRTNLLALNASIEAARGGEAGRGFAVVATEVKELATQTGKATEQVAQQIRAMQDTTGASVNALRDIANHIKQLETTSVSIAAAVDQQSNAGRDLAKSIDLAARGAEDVTSNIRQVHEASKATGAVASQVLSSATELEKQASLLRVKAGEFIGEVRKN